MTSEEADPQPWRWLACGMALACAPLAVLASYDSAVAYWATRLGEPVPAFVAADLRVRWPRVEQQARDAAWLAAHRAEAGRAATDMVRAEPLDSGAMRTLGSIAEIDRNGAGGERFRLAERINRRDAPTQFALITLAGESGDIPDGMAHYDRILRSAPYTASVLFPTLANAIRYENVRGPLLTYGKCEWFAQFLGTAVRTVDPGTVEDLYRRAYAAMRPAYRKSVGLALAARMLDSGHPAAARPILATVPGFAERGADTFGIAEGTVDTNYAPFAWSLRNDESVTTELGKDGRVTIRVSSGPTQPIATRTMLAPPGRYRLAMQVDATPGEPVAALSWKATCIGGTPMTELHVPARQVSSRIQELIEIPAGCDGQAWQLSATPEETQAASVITISGLLLSRQ